MNINRFEILHPYSRVRTWLRLWLFVHVHQQNIEAITAFIGPMDNGSSEANVYQEPRNTYLQLAGIRCFFGQFW